MGEVETAESLGELLGQVLHLDTISLQADLTSLPGAVPRFGKPTQTLNSNKVAIVPLSKVMAAVMAVRLRMALSHTVRRAVIHKSRATLSHNHRIIITLSTIKANMPSNNRSPLLPFNASLQCHTR